MNSGNKHHLKLPHLHVPHLHHHHHGKNEQIGDIPKGCVAVVVGQGEEERRRFVVPVDYINHPLFAKLLKEAEEEYGFEQKGAISIPCNVEEFCSVWSMIDRENDHHHRHRHNCNQHHHNNNHLWCFSV